MYGAEPRYNDLRYNDIPGLTMGMSLPEHKIFPVITIKSIYHRPQEMLIFCIFGNEHLMSCTNCFCHVLRTLKNTLDVVIHSMINYKFIR